MLAGSEKGTARRALDRGRPAPFRPVIHRARPTDDRAADRFTVEDSQDRSRRSCHRQAMARGRGASASAGAGATSRTRAPAPDEFWARTRALLDAEPRDCTVCDESSACLSPSGKPTTNETLVKRRRRRRKAHDLPSSPSPHRLYTNQTSGNGEHGPHHRVGSRHRHERRRGRCRPRTQPRSTLPSVGAAPGDPDRRAVGSGTFTGSDSCWHRPWATATASRWPRTG